jgi:putative (di)nucleoside polyphosphate hydrolase
MGYKLNVAGIVRDSAGKILVCERGDAAGAWQFPQGGVDGNETLEEALARELWEEISLTAADYTIVSRKGPYRYLYGNGRMKKGNHGKEQHYFLVNLSASKSRINVDTLHPEFQDTMWIAPEEFQITWLPEMKRPVYRAVLRDFFNIEV